MLQEPGTSPLKERTNIPLSTPPEPKLKSNLLRDIDGDKSLRRVMDRPPQFDASHPHQAPTYSFASDANGCVEDVRAPSPSPLPLSSSPETETESMPQIQLLRTAIDLLKAHAEDAGSHIEQLRVMLSNRSTDSATRHSRERARALEERREMDAHRALWSTTRKVTAILKNDEVTFEGQRLADQSLGLFNTSDRVVPPRDPSRTRNHRRLIPLALATKADSYHARERRVVEEELPTASVRGKSGTAAIYRQNANSADREALDKRIQDVEFAMPDYVGDLLLEFDTQSNPPLLPLSSPEKKADKPLPPSKSPSKPPPSALPLDKVPATGSASLDLPRTSAKPAPSPKRFSALFSSSSSKKSPSAITPTSPMRSAHSAVTSPLRSSISMSNMTQPTSASRRRSSSSAFSLVSIDIPPPEPQESGNDKKITSRIKKRFSRLRG